MEGQGKGVYKMESATLQSRREVQNNTAEINVRIESTAKTRHA